MRALLFMQQHYYHFTTFRAFFVLASPLNTISKRIKLHQIKKNNGLRYTASSGFWQVWLRYKKSGARWIRVGARLPSWLPIVKRFSSFYWPLETVRSIFSPFVLYKTCIIHILITDRTKYARISMKNINNMIFELEILLKLPLRCQ